ncbi:MAG: biotin/lipoyl-binding protein, partial [Bacteroidota bacterium]
MSRRDKRIMWIGIVLFAIIAIGVLTRQEEKTRIYTEGAAYRTIVETVSASGKVQPEVEVKISADVSGELVEVLIEEGRKVRAGDLLVKINPDISIAARDRAEASLNTSRANLANARARLTQSEAQLVNSRASYDRNKTLHKQGAISEADYDAAKSAFEVAVAEVDAAKQSVMASDYTVRSAEAS